MRLLGRGRCKAALNSPVVKQNYAQCHLPVCWIVVPSEGPLRTVREDSLCVEQMRRAVKIVAHHFLEVAIFC